MSRIKKLVGLALMVLLAAACGATTQAASSGSSVPIEFRAACGHPQAHVRVLKVPVTIRHSDCDLTGVLITYRDFGGAAVSITTGTTGTSSGFSLTVHSGSHDVTVNAQGVPGNA
jgi:hypothetical protein